MKKLIGLLLLFNSSFAIGAQPWGLCPGTPVTGQIPCDTSCFGPAGTNLGSTYTQAEAELQNAFADNTNSWVSANDTFLDYLGDYYEQSYLTNNNRVRALDGTSKTISLSLELLSEIHSRNIDHFVESYRILQTDFRVASVVHENSKTYMSNFGSHTGDYLLANIDSYANNKLLQDRLNVVNNLQADKANHLDKNQQSFLLGQVNNAMAGDLNIDDFDNLIVEGDLDEEELELVLTTIYTLYLNEDKNSKSLLNRSKNVKKEIALDALSKTLRFISNDNDLKSLEDDIYNQNFKADTSGSNKVALEHALKQEYIFQKAIENNLLNSYFKQAKTNNALKVISNR
ncbi:hypothetical protein EI165_10330 [Pseudoalteromonas nigrifaciens]|uniref:hypothetical protein n=1 Tax=Pseudoalteromonas nigrifaciens TaxID=28109 RepID=UPI0017877CED|nr:hypothetical protein [Pseudoalteromonas nigrifaciens]MBE0420517.1 hypothetical protein [Pseudoalteromonas nigrifaciens]